MKKELKKITMVIAIICLLMACKKRQETVNHEPTTSVANADKVLQYIKDIGFSSDRISDNGDEFTVEGDLSFPKDMEVPDYGAGVKTEQYYTGYLVNNSNKGDVRVFIDRSLSSMKNEINSGIAKWNSVSGSGLRFRIVNSGSYDVLIKDEYLPGSNGGFSCGLARFPSNGRAGNLVKINKSEVVSHSYAQRAALICHELGHTISLRHPNWSSLGEENAKSVPGVGGRDSYSIMNGNQCNSGPTELSDKDRQAIASLY